MAARRRSPFLSQAQAQAVVRYSPEEEALVALLQQAHQTFQQGVSSARGAARYSIGEINRARPELAKIYSIPGVNPKQSLAAPVLPAAGALDFNSASKFETQAAQQRFAQSRADALHGLTQQKTAAAAGAQFGAQQARQQYLQDLGTIDDRLVSLAGKKGAFIASTMGSLEQQAAQRALTRRGQSITRQNALTASADRAASLTERQRHDRQTEQQAATRAARAAKGRPATGQQLGSFHDTVGVALQAAKRMKDAGHSRGYIAQRLVLGRSPQTITTDPDGNKLKAPAHVPGIPKVPQLAASVALDLIFRGGVLSQGNVKALRQRFGHGAVHRLGYPRQNRAGRKVANAFPFG